MTVKIYINNMSGFSLHGIGINFKTSLIERFVKNHPEFTPRYSSNSRLNELKRIMGVKEPITTYMRLVARIIDCNPGIKYASDRSVIDELIFSHMNVEGINWYYNKSEDKGIDEILSNEDNLLKYESEFYDFRILIINENKRLVKENVNQDNHHNRLRFDLYENEEMYFYKQSIFVDKFRSMVPHIEFNIPDSDIPINKLFEETYERFEVLCRDYSIIQ